MPLESDQASQVSLDAAVRQETLSLLLPSPGSPIFHPPESLLVLTLASLRREHTGTQIWPFVPGWLAGQ